jgi:hypothetical protein
MLDSLGASEIAPRFSRARSAIWARVSVLVLILMRACACGEWRAEGRNAKCGEGEAAGGRVKVKANKATSDVDEEDF